MKEHYPFGSAKTRSCFGRFYCVLLLFCLLTFALSSFAQNCTINAGVDNTICANSTMTLVGAKSGSGAVTTTWTQVSGGAATITSPTSLTTTVTGFSAGSYTFRLSTTCLDGSAIFDEVTVTVSPIVVANAGPDQIYCPGAASLAGNAASPGTGAWSIQGTNNAGLTITTSSSATSAISLPTTSVGATTLRWTITQGACSSFDDVIITNRGGATPVNAGVDQTLSNCYTSSTSATLAGSVAGSGNGQTGAWSLVSGPNTPTITTPSSRTSTVTGLVQGVYTLRWTASGSCVNGFDDMLITVPAPSATLTTANGGGNLTYCDGRTSIVLNGNTPSYAGESGVWTQTSGPVGATITSPTSAVTSVTGLNGSSSYGFQYKITNSNSGCTSTSTVSLAYNTAPAITVNSGNDFISLNCGVSTVSIPYTVSGGSTTQYRVISAPSGYTLSGSFSNASTSNTGNQTQSVSGLTIPGTYLIRFQRTGGTGCTTAFDDVSVIVGQSPTASEAGTYQTLACNVVATSLAGNIPAVGTGSWSQVSGPNTAVIAVPTLNTSGISGLINGKYVFKWIISGGTACPATEDTVSVTVASTTPTAASAGPDMTVCHTSPISLSGNQPALNEWGVWTVSPSAGVTIANPSSATTTVTGLSPNTAYTFTWTISNACGTTSDDVVVTTDNNAGPVQASAGPDQCLASGTNSLTLTGNSPSPLGATGLWSQATGPTSATIASPSSASSTVSGLANGTYQFVRTLVLTGCNNTTDTMTVTIAAAATTANAGADQNLCATAATLNGNSPSTGTGTWTQYAGPGGAVITAPGTNNTTITSLVPGSYTFRWTISNGACASNFDDVVINVSAAPSAADAGIDQTCLSGSTATLAAAAPASGVGTWSQISGPAAATVATLTANNSGLSSLVSGVYTFRWTVAAGPACAASTDDVVVSVNPTANAGSGATLCNVSTVSLSGNTNTTGTWTQDSGPNTATLTSYGGNIASAENLVPGTYVFRYSLAPVGSCTPMSATRQIIIQAPPSAAVVGANQSVCNVTSFSLSATAPTSGTGAWTKLSGGSGSFSPNANAANATFTGATTGLYSFEWKVSYSGNCANSAQMTVNNAALPSAANAGVDQSFCAASATLAGTAPASGTGSWSQVSGPNTASITNTALATSPVSSLVSGTYTLRWTISSGACTATTDDVLLAVCTALPLRLLAFGAEKNGGLVQLQWRTADEQSFKEFVLERSGDGASFVPLKTIVAKGESFNEYSETDNPGNANGGRWYYRLKMVDANATFVYSNVVSVAWQGKSVLSFSVVPNPVKAAISIVVESSRNTLATVRVSNPAGNVVWQETKRLATGTNNVSLSEGQSLPNGVYVISVQTPDATQSQKLIIHR